MRILHFSDVHIDVSPRRIPWRDWVGKRWLGAANHWLRRRRRFRHAREKLVALARFADEHAIDLAVCTGDYTILGTDVELEAARQAVEPLTRRPHGFVTVPGNHDVYLEDAVREKRFEKHFGEFLRNDLPELALPDGWPQVRWVGHDVAVLAVRSARPNPELWRSSGRVDPAELEALARAVRDSRVRERFVLIATHYALRRPDGTADVWLHGLENAEALLAAIADLPRGCVLHGHIHERFWLRLPGIRPAILGAGSATDECGGGLWVLDIDAEGAIATPGFWDGRRYQLDRRGAVPLP